MFGKTIEDLVNELIQLDVDAYHAYGDAIKAIKEEDIHLQLTMFQKDHERHVMELSDMLKVLGGEPIKFNRDFKGFIIEGMTMLQSLMGTKGALKAMLINEKITNKKYSDALEYKELTQELRNLVNYNFNDEKRHLEYVKKILAELDKKVSA